MRIRPRPAIVILSALIGIAIVAITLDTAENHLKPENSGKDASTVAKLTVYPHAGNSRPSDALANPYSEHFLDSFPLAETEARLEYSPKSSSFAGKLTLRKMKPNFIYQLKLAGTADDIETMERLGFAGRWLLPGEGTNFSDDDYRALADKKHAESYIFFDWVLTDGDGNATKSFRLDSSWHVLMSETLESAEHPADIEPILLLFSKFPPNCYPPDEEFRRKGVIWPMSEHYWSGSRPEPGGTVLPPGRYRCLFRLTEECFHGVGGGFWATAAECKVDFEVAAE
ncbi:MAG: hypothetical protein Kow00107_11140 [Planctomycetota bacterium]